VQYLGEGERNASRSHQDVYSREEVKTKTTT
jgi:hypothetical protein